MLNLAPTSTGSATAVAEVFPEHASSGRTSKHSAFHHHLARASDLIPAPDPNLILRLRGKLNGHAIRVPMLNSSITDMVFIVGRDTTAEEVNGMLQKASMAGSCLAATVSSADPPFGPELLSFDLL